MRYRISEIKIGPAEYGDPARRMTHIEKALGRELRKRCGRPGSGTTGGRSRHGRGKAAGRDRDRRSRMTGSREISFRNMEIIRESIDARHKPQVKAVYTLDFDCDLPLPLPEGGREEYRLPDPGPGPERPSRRNGLPCERRPSHGFRPPDGSCLPDETGSPDAEGPQDGPRPVIAGFGPCGIFAGLILAEAGCRPLIIERGQAVDRRMADVRRFWEEGILDPESNVQFGEGGAGTFSDGKLTTGIRDIRIRKVLQVFVDAGADPAILYQQKPHIGTDRLRQIIPRIRQRIEALGGQVLFGTRLTGIETDEEGRLSAVRVLEKGGDNRGQRKKQEDGDGREAGGSRDEGPCGTRIPTHDLILAIGHSARDTFRMLSDLGLPMEQKAFSIGVRIQHPQERIDAAQYGDPRLAEVFGPAIYKLSHRCGNGRGVYTFCMCPGGRVINASSEEGTAVTNGMSESARDSGMANSGLLVDVRPADFGSHDPLAGIAFQRRYERLAWDQARRQARDRSDSRGEGQSSDLRDRPDEAAEVRRTGEGRPGPGPGLPVTEYGQFRADPQDPVRQSLPAFAVEAILEAMPHLGRKLKGFDAEDAVMAAVETRSSSPVRILRDKDMQSGIPGLIPAGEGPGYAGGIVSAAVDGIRAAEEVLRRGRGCREEGHEG